MREHEVPTHVQAEDRVLLGFTFPQVVAVVAVCALSYGAYRYAPVGPSQARMAIAVVFGLVGIAMVVGKIGGRRLPLVAADLLKFNLGARRYAGPVSQLVRSEPIAPAQPAKSGPGPLRLMAKKTKRVLRRLKSGRKRRAKQKDRRSERRPFRPHGWFGKRRQKEARKDHGQEHRTETLESARRRPRKGFLAFAVVALLAVAVAAVPQSAFADGHEEGEPWRDEIEFDLTEPVDGRRIFVEGLSVTGDRAAVTLRAATDIDLRVRAFGGSQGTALRFWGSARLTEGERIDYSLPLNGPMPSFTVSWEDGLSQAGALTVKHEHIPYPLPSVEGELCELRVTSLGWRPGYVSGVVESECVTEIEQLVELQTVSGHESVTETAVMEARVTAVTGTLAVSAGGSAGSVPFVSDGDTTFRVPVAVGAAVHDVTVDAELAASLSIPIPPLTVLTHHPERVEKVTKTVQLHRPGASDYDSETVTVTHEDGTTESATATAYVHVPSATIAKVVTVDVLHPEHVKAEVVERSPISKTRTESLSLSSGVGSDDPFQTLVLPEPEPEEEHGDQAPAGGLADWFERLGWEWPW